MKAIKYICSLLTALISLNSSAAHATDSSGSQWWNDNVNINLGGFLTSRDTDVRIDSKTLGKGTEISAENDLGLDDEKNTFRADAYVRLGQRHRLGVSFYDMSRSNTRVINRTIQ